MKEILYVEWIDATATSAWSAFDSEDLKPHHIKSVGFLVKETDQFLSLAAAVGGDECNAVINIPKPWITRRQLVCPSE